MLAQRWAAGTGIHRHSGRGLCNPCVRQLTPDQLLDFERITHTRDEILDDYDLLRRQGYSRRKIAERIGVSLAALEQCIWRARRVCDPRAKLGPR
jgi:transposase-like protein